MLPYVHRKKYKNWHIESGKKARNWKEVGLNDIILMLISEGWKYLFIFYKHNYSLITFKQNIQNQCLMTHIFLIYHI